MGPVTRSCLMIVLALTFVLHAAVTAQDDDKAETAKRPLRWPSEFAAGSQDRMSRACPTITV